MESNPKTSITWKRVSLVLLLICCAAVLFCRKSDAFLRPQFWAEDGPVYFLSARDEGIDSWLKPHNGSLYLFQRLVAWAGSWLPVRFAPTYFNYASLAAILGVAAYIARSRTNIRFSWLCALAVAASPHEGEVFLNLTNVHWVLSLALVFVLISADPKTARGAVLEATMVLVLCLSGPFILVLLPFFLLRAFRNRTGYRFLLAGIAFFSFCLELRFANPNRAVGPVNFRDPSWLNLLGDRISGLLFLGNGGVGIPADSVWLVAVSALLYGILLVAACIRRDKACLVFLGTGCLLILATAYGYRGMPALGGAPRYCYVPAVCVVWALIRTLQRSRVLAPAAALALLCICVSSFFVGRSVPLPNLHWAKESRGIGGPGPWHVSINPSPWAIYYCPKGRPAEDIIVACASGRNNERNGPSRNERRDDAGRTLDLKLDQPREVLEATIEYQLAPQDAADTDVRMSWRRLGSRGFQLDDRTARIKAGGLGGLRTLTVWVYDTIDRIKIESASPSTDFKGCTVHLRTLQERHPTEITLLDHR